MPAADEELMRRASEGDLVAFGELFDRHHASLFGFLCRFFGDRPTAEDVAQEVFCRAWERRATFDPQRSFRPWLYAIARNRAINEASKPHRRDTLFADLTTCRGYDDSLAGLQERGAHDHELAVDRLTTGAQVRAALQSLPPSQRMCLVLREYEGCSHREIGAILGCSEANARVLTHRARRALRELLRPLLEREECCA